MPSSPRARSARLPRAVLTTACAVGLLGPLPPRPALAADYGVPAQAAGPIITSDQAGARRLDIEIGRSVVIELPRDAKEVFVANPKVANAVVRSTRKVFVIGMDNGGTSIFVMDAEGRQIAALEVNVGRDLNILRQTLRTALPKARVEIKPAGDSVLLTGQVASAAEAQQAMDIAGAFVGVGGGGAAPGGAGAASASKGGVINALTILGKDQVMLRVTVAEVQRSVLKQLGVNLTGNWSALALRSLTPFGLSGGLQNGDSVLDAATNQPFSLKGTAHGGNASVNAQLQAFERAGVSRVLAEPTLAAVSGETAQFLVGGEIPVPVVTCTTVCTPSTTFKKFGVSLTFTPLVLAESRISLRVATEVSEVDSSYQATVGGLNTPGFRVRRSETTVELPSGSVMMTAGLIQQRSEQSINGLPGLLNLPILGTLFRSRDYKRNETEMMIIVSPVIAKPMEADQVQRPDDGFVDPHDAQATLLGRLNKLYGVAGAPPPRSAKTLKGRFGFITD